MNKKKFLVNLLILIVFLCNVQAVRGDENIFVYPRVDRVNYEYEIKNTMPIGTVVIGDKGYSLAELHSRGMKETVDSAEHVYIKKEAGIWIDHITQKSIDKEILPEIEYLDKEGNTLFFHEGDGELIKEKSSKAYFILQIMDENIHIGSLLKGKKTLSGERVYSNIDFFRIESLDGENMTRIVSISDENYVYPKIDSLAVDNKVNITLFDYNMEKVASFKNIEIKNGRIIITDKSQVERNTIYVSSTQELMDAIGPNRKIIVKKGVYDILDFKEKPMEEMDEYYGRYLTASDKVEIRGVSGLIIEGEDRENLAELVINPRDLFVLTIFNSTGVTLRNLRIGHTETGDVCSGGVIEIMQCEDITIDNCELYGCGTEALAINNSEEIEVTTSVLEDCYHGIATMSYSKHININNTIIRNNGDRYGISAASCEDIVFDNNIFENNKANEELFSFWPKDGADENSIGLVVKNCVFEGNKAKMLYVKGNDKWVIFNNNSYKSNTFNIEN